MLKAFQLPQRVFACKTLVVLKVDSNCISLAPPPSASTCFPSLKSLHYKAFGLVNATVFEMLFPNKCPVLEELTIDRVIVAKDGGDIKISAPGLKTFRIFYHSYEYCDEYSFFINAPKLESLVVSGNASFSNYYFSDDAKSMVKADIHSIHLSDEEHTIPATLLLGGVSGVKCLSLSTPSFLASSLPSII